MADIKQVKSNVAKLVSMDAPESDIDQYISEEGFTIDDVRNFSISDKSTDGMRGVIPQFGRGLAEGGASLIPTAKAISRAISPIAPEAMENLISPLWERGPRQLKEQVETLPQQEDMTLPEKIARGIGNIAPTLLPMARGARFIEALPTILRRQGIARLPTLAGRGLLKTIARPAVGLGGYEGAKAALTGEDVRQAALQGAGAGAIFGPASKLGASILPGRIGSAAGGALGGALTSPEDPLTGAITMAGLGAMNPNKPANIERGRIKVASRLVNSLIKPSEKELRIGDAGRGISREGIWDWTMEGLRNKTVKKLSYLNNKLSSLYSAYKDKRADYQDTLKPIYDLQKELISKRSTTESGTIDKIGDILKDLIGNNSFENITPSEARALKQEINKFKKSEFEKKTNIESGPSAIEQALNEVYRNIDSRLDKLVDGSAELNTRVTDLIDAKDIIDKQMRKIQSSSIVSRGNIFSPSTYEEILPPAIKTGIASIVAPRYGKLIPRQIETMPEQNRLGIEIDERKMLPSGRIPPSRRIADMSSKRTIEQGSEASELGQINLPPDIQEGYRYLQEYGGKAINLPSYEELIKSKQAIMASGVSEAETNDIIRQHLIDTARKNAPSARGLLP